MLYHKAPASFATQWQHSSTTSRIEHTQVNSKVTGLLTCKLFFRLGKWEHERAAEAARTLGRGIWGGTLGPWTGKTCATILTTPRPALQHAIHDRLDMGPLCLMCYPPHGCGPERFAVRLHGTTGAAHGTSNTSMSTMGDALWKLPWDRS